MNTSDQERALTFGDDLSAHPSVGPRDLHELAEVLKWSGWMPRARALGFWREVMIGGERRSQYIDPLGSGKVELWGGGITWGTVMNISEVPAYLESKET